MSTFKQARTLAVTFAWATATGALASNNLNPPGSLCLDLRGAGQETAQGVCQTSDSECTDGLHCVDDDLNPLNGGICADRAWYGLGFEVVVDVELGPTTEPACGAQVFLEWDTQALSFVSLETDPDGELGWPFALREAVDEVAGTIDLAIALPVATTCDDEGGTFDGGTVARLTFLALDAGETDGVGFRPNNSPSGASGPAGYLPVNGCNGDSQPTGTGRLYIDLCPFDNPDDTDGDGVCDWWGQGLTLRGKGRGSSFRSRHGRDWHDGAATQARIAAREVVSLAASGSFGYDCGLKSDNWEIPVKTLARSCKVFLPSLRWYGRRRVKAESVDVGLDYDEHGVLDHSGLIQPTFTGHNDSFRPLAEAACRRSCRESEGS